MQSKLMIGVIEEQKMQFPVNTPYRMTPGGLSAVTFAKHKLADISGRLSVFNKDGMSTTLVGILQVPIIGKLMEMLIKSVFL